MTAPDTKRRSRRTAVKVVSATEVISEGAEGIILDSVLEGYAEYYSADLSEKVVRGMTDNVLKCKFNGDTLPIGYVIDAFINAVSLYDDKLARTFHYKEVTKTVTFSDSQDEINNKSGLHLDCCGAPRRSKLCIACSDFLLPE